MIQKVVSDCLARYFTSHGLKPIQQFNVFNHSDDADERSFIIDLAIGPVATKGNRSFLQASDDRTKFENCRDQIDLAIEGLKVACLFPIQSDFNSGWHSAPNPDPVVGVALEIENNMSSKYFLGSLLAASIAGHWGVLIVQESIETKRWIKTIRRMIHKGTNSPIPSNLAIYSWTKIEGHINSIQPDTAT